MNGLKVNRVILFDLDGTVIDSTEAILESFTVSYKEFEKEKPSDEDIKALIGHPLDDMYRSLGIIEAEVDAYVNAYKKHYRKISKEKTFLIAGAKEAIEYAASHARLGVVTTKTAKYSKELLEHFEILHHFEVLIGREDVQNPKPHEEPILKALFLMNTQRENSFMIGDTRLDVFSAQNAGIECVTVSTGYDTKEKLSLYNENVKDTLMCAVEHIVGTFK